MDSVLHHLISSSAQNFSWLLTTTIANNAQKQIIIYAIWGLKLMLKFIELLSLTLSRLSHSLSRLSNNWVSSCPSAKKSKRPLFVARRRVWWNKDLFSDAWTCCENHFKLILFTKRVFHSRACTRARQRIDQNNKNPRVRKNCFLFFKPEAFGWRRFGSVKSLKHILDGWVKDAGNS